MNTEKHSSVAEINSLTKKIVPHLIIKLGISKLSFLLARKTLAQEKVVGSDATVLLQ